MRIQERRLRQLIRETLLREMDPNANIDTSDTGPTLVDPELAHPDIDLDSYFSAQKIPGLTVSQTSLTTVQNKFLLEVFGEFESFARDSFEDKPCPSVLSLAHMIPGGGVYVIKNVFTPDRVNKGIQIEKSKYISSLNAGKKTLKVKGPEVDQLFDELLKNLETCMKAYLLDAPKANSITTRQKPGNTYKKIKEFDKAHDLEFLDPGSCSKLADDLIADFGLTIQIYNPIFNDALNKELKAKQDAILKASPNMTKSGAPSTADQIATSQGKNRQF